MVLIIFEDSPRKCGTISHHDVDSFFLTKQYLLFSIGGPHKNFAMTERESVYIFDGVDRWANGSPGVKERKPAVGNQIDGIPVRMAQARYDEPRERHD